MKTPRASVPTVRALLFAVKEAFQSPPVDPPLGSNRPLGLGLCHLLVASVTPLMFFMVVGALLSDTVSDRSTAISAAWLAFVAPIAVFMRRIPERYIRALLLLCLAAIQIRWTLAWLTFPPEDMYASVMITLIFTPLLLFLVSLMEGRRSGVIVGLLVAANMGVAVSLGVYRESLASVSLSDPRFGIPTFVVMLLYAVAVNIWTSQQEVLQDAQLQVALLHERANCDPATGLLNRRGLELVVAGWRNRGIGFTVLMVQQDRLDTLAEVLGEEQTHLALEALAQRIEALPDEAVTAARWSNRTLVMLSRHAERESAERLAQTLRRSVVEIEPESADWSATVSVGYTLVASDEPFDLALSRAESALSTALLTGNCVRALLVV